MPHDAEAERRGRHPGHRNQRKGMQRLVHDRKDHQAGQQTENVRRRAETDVASAEFARARMEMATRRSVRPVRARTGGGL